MVGAIIAIILLISGGFTVQAADQAKPGDFLFPLDQVVENMQLKLSSNEKKQELKLKFASERVAEVAELATELNTQAKAHVAIHATTTDDINVDDNSNTTDTAVVETDDEEESADEVRTNENFNAALNFAIEYLDLVKADLSAKGNTEAEIKLDELINSLSNQLDNLSAKTKAKIKFKNDAGKVEFEMEKESDSDHDAGQKVQVELKTKIKNNFHYSTSSTKTNVDESYDEDEMSYDGDSSVESLIKINVNSEKSYIDDSHNDAYNSNIEINTESQASVNVKTDVWSNTGNTNNEVELEDLLKKIFN